MPSTFTLMLNLKQFSSLKSNYVKYFVLILLLKRFFKIPCCLEIIMTNVCSNFIIKSYLKYQYYMESSYSKHICSNSTIKSCLKYRYYMESSYSKHICSNWTIKRLKYRYYMESNYSKHICPNSIIKSCLKYVLFCTIMCIIFTSLCKNFVKLTWVLAEAFRCHGHHFQCLTVLTVNH